jgi:hypothetical protein
LKFHATTLTHIALRSFRAGVFIAILLLLYTHSVRVRVTGLKPITLEEVRALLPSATTLEPDAGERRGLHVLDGEGKRIGYTLCTSPESDTIIGYRGSTDVLLVFDAGLRVRGVRIRSSRDTNEHVGDIRDDRTFLKTWNGMTWDAVAGRTPEEAGIEGVSGSSLTSLAIAEGIVRRLRAADSRLATEPPAWRFSGDDLGLFLACFGALWLCFRGTHGRRWVRVTWLVFLFGYVGFLNGGLLSQSLIVGWAQHGIPFRTAPGLVLMLALALLVPWAGGKPLYCQHLCPHGAAQELISRVAPKRWRLQLDPRFAQGLKWLPFFLLALVLFIAIAFLPEDLPLDLAALEPFDAYLLKAAGVATLAIAGAGLVFSAFVPMAYCHYGCPTGFVLSFLRYRKGADSFGRREWAGLALAGFAWFLFANAEAIHAWIVRID